MASHSPQRSRRPPQTQQQQQQQQQHNQGTMLSHPARETSPSPSLRERPRALKAQSMPLVPSIASFNVQQTAQQQQASPTISTNGMRRSPPLGQLPRVLPTPPQTNQPAFADDPSPQQPSVSLHYPRPPLRAPIAGYPNKFQELESQMTPEFFADIDRAAEQQQAQYQSSQQQVAAAAGAHVYPLPASAEGSSPSIPDSVSRARREQLAREAAQQARQNSSPIASSFVPQQQQQQQQTPMASHTPERRMSPAQHSPAVVVKPGEPHPASYLAAYNAREAPATVRRAPNSDGRLNVSMPSFSPPLQTIATRTPDRSLPVQEEDEVLSKNGAGWKVSSENNEQPYRSPSPTSSSDVQTPDVITTQRFDNVQISSGYREDEKGSMPIDDSHVQYVERDSTEEDASYTPRSPAAAGLPEDNRDTYYSGQNIPVRVPAPNLPKGKARNGSSDHVMRGLETTLLDQQPPQQPQPQQAPAVQAPPQQTQSTERPAQHADQRKQPEQDNHQYQDYPPDSFYGVGPPIPQNARYIPAPQVYPDDFHGYADEYLQAYLQSPRPDAPVPPTPHSQSTAPSPSPLLHGYNLGAFRPARAAGSPYPYPYDHVRRNRQIQQGQRFFPNGIDQSTITDKVARQWQIYAQNNHGAVTDSTLSPSATPFRPNDRYDEWAILHTTRMMRQNANPRVMDGGGGLGLGGGVGGMGMLDTASIHSSPSHQPVALPIPPNFASRRKERGMHAKRLAYSRRPPPRVESTQPRETSPELSSSGEETAGEDRGAGVYSAAADRDNVARDPLPFPVSASTPVNDDDVGEWIDEDEDDDYEDLIDLEYHPTFVKNITKRRRKWEVGWENLIQAFQALDRQTDATMILLASPSHTTKLHALKSRSIRRHPNLANSSNIKEIRSGFSRIATQRRITRPDKSSLVDRLLLGNSSASGDGSDGSSSGSVEENLKRALDAALGSLSAMGEVYEQREARVMEELHRSREDRERVELLLRQVLGDKYPFNGEKQLLTSPMK